MLSIVTPYGNTIFAKQIEAAIYRVHAAKSLCHIAITCRIPFIMKRILCYSSIHQEGAPNKSLNGYDNR